MPFVAPWLQTRRRSLRSSLARDNPVDHRTRRSPIAHRLRSSCSRFLESEGRVTEYCCTGVVLGDAGWGGASKAHGVYTPLSIRDFGRQALWPVQVEEWFWVEKIVSMVAKA